MTAGLPIAPLFPGPRYRHDLAVCAVSSDEPLILTFEYTLNSFVPGWLFSCQGCGARGTALQFLFDAAPHLAVQATQGAVGRPALWHSVVQHRALVALDELVDTLSHSRTTTPRVERILGPGGLPRRNWSARL